MADIRKPIFDAIRAARGGKSFDRLEVGAVDNLLDALGVARTGAAPAASSSAEPDWLAFGRTLIGLREIVGPQHNSWIVAQWKKLGAPWFKDDETPWCGEFAASCMDAVGLPYPANGQFARALAWKDWGKPCGPILGAVAVFGRQGGGHVGFLVGQDAAHFHVLGGNQGNSVSIMPVAKARLVATRWPIARTIDDRPLPAMSGGTVSGNEQ